jgi:hypothetical protein
MNHIIGFLIAFIMVSPAYAAKIMSIKQNRVLLDLEGQDLQVGQKIFTVDSAGKKRSVIQITQVKNGKAVAEISKGTPSPDHKLQVIAQSGPPRNEAKIAEQKKHAPKTHDAWGLAAGFAMNSMKVKLSSTPVDLKGNSFSLKGFYQTKLDGAVSVKGSLGYESFKASGAVDSGVCGTSTTKDCNVDISYLGMDALIRYSFYDKTFNFWAGGGLALLFAISKDSNVLDTGKITTNQAIVGSVGVDYPMSKTTFIPMQLDYNLFPDNSSTSANQIVIRVGYGMDF